MSHVRLSEDKFVRGESERHSWYVERVSTDNVSPSTWSHDEDIQKYTGRERLPVNRDNHGLEGDVRVR